MARQVGRSGASARGLADKRRVKINGLVLIGLAICAIFMLTIGSGVGRIGLEAEQQVDQRSADRVRADVASLPMERVRQVFAEAQRGRLGSIGQDLAIAARNASGGEPAEDELRSCVADILALREDGLGNGPE